MPFGMFDPDVCDDWGEEPPQRKVTDADVPKTGHPLMDNLTTVPEVTRTAIEQAQYELETAETMLNLLREIPGGYGHVVDLAQDVVTEKQRALYALSLDSATKVYDEP